MSDPTLLLFDDDDAARWRPFTLTRPAGELRFGVETLRARAERVLGLRCAAHLADDPLPGWEEDGAPPVRALSDAPAEGDRLLLCSRAVLSAGAGEALRRLPPGPFLVDGRAAGWWLPAGEPAPSEETLREPAGAAAAGRALGELPGRMLGPVWELMTGTSAQVAADVAEIHPDAAEPELPVGVHRQGMHPLVLGEGVRIEPGVLIDTSDGPVWLDDGATVRALTRLAGPAYVGRGSTILGGSVEAASIGAVCKIRGEFAESVCLDYVNKAHDGHIGHAYLGRWVNLGAGTTNSDLKNNYGAIRLWTPEGEVDTGEIKVGCFLGDHVKTGIGLLLNTGTVIGAGSNLFGAEMPPRYVPPFSWGTGSEFAAYRVDKFLEVARRVAARRDVTLSDGMLRQLRRAWDVGRLGEHP